MYQNNLSKRIVINFWRVIYYQEAELSLTRSRYSGEGGARREEADRHAQRLLEAREASHREHVARLEAQVLSHDLFLTDMGS